MPHERCGDCKHWGKAEESKERFRSCTAVIHDENYKIDERSDGYLASEPEKFADELAFRDAHKAVTQDGSGYFAALMCREDFGCVLFEPKAGEGADA